MRSKFLLSAFIFAIIGLCLTLSLSAMKASAADEDLSQIVYLANSSRSVKIYEQAVREFKIVTFASEGEKIAAYNDNFAGAYIDDEGFLNIGYVGIQHSALGFGEQVMYRKQVYSYNYLQEVQNALKHIMAGVSIFTVGIKQSRNQVDVYLNKDYDIERIISYLQAEKLYNKTAVNFIVDPDGKNIENSTAYGGDRIDGSIYGTICANVVDNQTGRFGVLTNEHVATNGTIMYHNGSPLSIIGQRSKSMRSETIDAAFIPFANQNDWDTTAHARYKSAEFTNIRLGTEDFIIENLPVMKIGQTTGVTYGHITYTNATEAIYYISEPKHVLFSDIIKYSNHTDGGDSGGPVYFNGETDDLYLIGMHFAGMNNGVGGAACRITEVMRLLDVTPITDGAMYNTTNLYDNGIQIDSINFVPFNGKIAIPDTIGGRTVTHIGASAFSGNTSLKSIIIPSAVTNIGVDAFSGCISLVINAQAAEKPADWAEDWNPLRRPVYWGIDDTNYVQIDDAEYVVQNGNAALTRYIGAATAFIVPDQVIVGGTTYFIPGIGKVVDGGTLYDVTCIEKYAFYACESLTSITIRDSVKSVMSWAFSYCTALETITLPFNTDIFFPNAFMGCSSNLEVIYTGSPIIIEQYSLYNELEVMVSGNTERYIYFEISGLKMIQLCGSPDTYMIIEYYYYDFNTGESELVCEQVYGGDFIMLLPNLTNGGLIKVTIGNNSSSSETVKLVIWNAVKTVFAGDYEGGVNGVEYYDDWGTYYDMFYGFSISCVYVMRYEAVTAGTYEINLINSFAPTLYLYNAHTGEMVCEKVSGFTYNPYLEAGVYYIVTYAFSGQWTLTVSPPA